MVTNKILIFGGNGLISNSFQQLVLPTDWEMEILTFAACDLMQPSVIGTAVQSFSPDIVINAASMSDIDACEKDPDTARKINFHAVANIAGQCDTVSAPLIHLSTAAVFDGRDSAPYSPDDGMNPINIYGQMAMMGEEAARHGLYWHVILRTSLVFSAFGDNILTKTLRQIDTQDEVRAATDQTISPTSSLSVAEALVTMTDAILKGKGNGFGTFHVASKAPATRFEFLHAVMDAYAPFTTRRPKLVPVSAAALSNIATHPANTALNCDKTQEVYGIQPSDWRKDLVKAVTEYVEMQ